MQFDAIGTHWSIETTSPLDDVTMRMIHACIEAFDQTYSRFRDDSLVAEMAQKAGTYTLPDNGKALFELYQKLYTATDGAMTPLVGDALSAMGYDKTYSLTPRQSPDSAPAWEEVFEWHNTTLTMHRPAMIDVGAAGKGLLVDEVGKLLERQGISQYVVDASGDMRHRGDPGQIVGLEDPNDPTRVIGTMTIHNTSLCASATNRRAWGDGMHHVIDGRTGTPTRKVRATWVSAETTMLADGLATALFFCDPDRLLAIGPFQFVRLFSNGTIEYSKDFVGELFI